MSNSVAPAGGSDGGGGLFVYDESRDTYDLNTRILATAVICLACVVVLMVFVHLYVRQALLGGRGAAARQRTTAGASHLLRFYVSDRPAGQEGLDPAAISALPAHPYRAPAATTDGGGGEAAECAICLGAVAEEEAVRVMPGCKHMFHVDCIDIWLGSHSTCPVCRTAVEPPPAVGEAPPPSESKEPGPASFRFGSFRRMLSWERSSMGRRAQGEGMEDLERQ